MLRNVNRRFGEPGRAHAGSAPPGLPLTPGGAGSRRPGAGWTPGGAAGRALALLALVGVVFEGFGPGLGPSLLEASCRLAVPALAVAGFDPAGPRRQADGGVAIPLAKPPLEVAVRPGLGATLVLGVATFGGLALLGPRRRLGWRALAWRLAGGLIAVVAIGALEVALNVGLTARRMLDPAAGADPPLLLRTASTLASLAGPLAPFAAWAALFAAAPARIGGGGRRRRLPAGRR